MGCDVEDHDPRIDELTNISEVTSITRLYMACDVEVHDP